MKNRLFSAFLSPDLQKLSRLFSSCSTSAYRLRAYPHQTRFKRIAGFTLLEVMVALAIFATAAMALTQVAIQYTQSTSHAILRTKAQFVALNEQALMEIQQDWLTGTQSKQVTLQGESWQIDKSAQPTISPNVQRVEVQVSLFNPNTGQVEAGITHLVFFNHRVAQ